MAGFYFFGKYQFLSKHNLTINDNENKAMKRGIKFAVIGTVCSLGVVTTISSSMDFAFLWNFVLGLAAVVFTTSFVPRYRENVD